MNWVTSQECRIRYLGQTGRQGNDFQSPIAREGSLSRIKKRLLLYYMWYNERKILRYLAYISHAGGNHQAQKTVIAKRIIINTYDRSGDDYARNRVSWIYRDAKIFLTIFSVRLKNKNINGARLLTYKRWYTHTANRSKYAKIVKLWVHIYYCTVWKLTLG